MFRFFISLFLMPAAKMKPITIGFRLHFNNLFNNYHLTNLNSEVPDWDLVSIPAKGSDSDTFCPPKPCL